MMDHTNHAGQQFQKNNDDHGLLIDKVTHLSEALLEIKADLNGYKRAIYAVGFLVGGIAGIVIKYGSAIYHFIKVKL